MPKRRLALTHNARHIWSRLVCPFSDCCAPAGEDLLGDSRRHSVVSRARGLQQVASIHATGWRWNLLTRRLAEGIDLAERLNALSPSSSALPGIDIVSLQALHDVANARRTRRAIIRRTA